MVGGPPMRPRRPALPGSPVRKITRPRPALGDCGGFMMARDLVVVSMHERGFPQGDLYCGCGDMGPSEFEALGTVPDSFFTLARGRTIEDAVAHARGRWPEALVVVADDDPAEDDLGAGPTAPLIDIVFDGPPSYVSGRFVEVESPPGKSIRLGEWLQRADGYWVLRFNAGEALEGS